jgi:hypothetical protein
MSKALRSKVSDNPESNRALIPKISRKTAKALRKNKYGIAATERKKGPRMDPPLGF